MSVKRSKSDQFLLRLPPGLRDRIKAYAEYQGRSMNEEIVRILEREFPEPWIADARIEDLLDMLGVLQRSGATESGIAKLVSDLKETIEGIYSGRVAGLDKETRERIQSEYLDWQMREAENEMEIASMEYDEIESESLSRTGRSEKFVYPDGTVAPKHELEPWSKGNDKLTDDPFPDPVEDDEG